MGTYIRKTQRTYHRRSYLHHRGEYIPLSLSIRKTKDMLKSCNNEVWQNLTQHFNEREQVGFFWTIPRYLISFQFWLHICRDLFHLIQSKKKPDFTNFAKSSPILQFLLWTELYGEVRTGSNKHLIWKEAFSILTCLITRGKFKKPFHIYFL